MPWRAGGWRDQMLMVTFHQSFFFKTIIAVMKRSEYVSLGTFLEPRGDIRRMGLWGLGSLTAGYRLARVTE